MEESRSKGLMMSNFEMSARQPSGDVSRKLDNQDNQV